jgi:hypothetical protein
MEAMKIHPDFGDLIEKLAHGATDYNRATAYARWAGRGSPVVEEDPKLYGKMSFSVGACGPQTDPSPVWWIRRDLYEREIVEKDARIKELETRTICPTWGGLVVHVTKEAWEQMSFTQVTRNEALEEAALEAEDSGDSGIAGLIRRLKK